MTGCHILANRARQRFFCGIQVAGLVTKYPLKLTQSPLVKTVGHRILKRDAVHSNKCLRKTNPNHGAGPFTVFTIANPQRFAVGATIGIYPNQPERVHLQMKVKMQMSNDPFNPPSTSTGIQWDDHKGELLLITIKEQRTGIQTAFGEADAIEADVTCLDGEHQGTTFTDILIFPKVLQSQLRPSIGGMVLGRLGQGDKKAGQSAPWKLADPTEDDRKTGLAWLNAQQPVAPF